MNMKSAALAAFATLAMAAFGPQAMAADNGFYLGAGISQSTTKLGLSGFGSDSVDDTGYKVIAGWRPLNWLAVEANYMDLGGDSSDGTSIDSSAVTVTALLIAEIGIVDLYAKGAWPCGTPSSAIWATTFRMMAGNPPTAWALVCTSAASV
jgi:hypothetical protein